MFKSNSHRLFFREYRIKNSVSNFIFFCLNENRNNLFDRRFIFIDLEEKCLVSPIINAIGKCRTYLNYYYGNLS